MQLDKKISIENIVTWGVLLAGMIAGYVQLKADVVQANRDADEAKASVVSAAKELMELKIVSVRTEERVKNIDSKIDEIRQKIN